MKCQSCIALVFMLALVIGIHAERPLAESTVVVYNTAVPDSVDLAKFYAEQRGIGQDYLVGLDCPIEEEITRQQYDATTLRDPNVNWVGPLEEADAWVKQNKPNQALDLIRDGLRTASDAPASSLLEKLEQELTATPTSSPNKP
jgi:hypothetical protein